MIWVSVLVIATVYELYTCHVSEYYCYVFGNGNPSLRSQKQGHYTMHVPMTTFRLTTLVADVFSFVVKCSSLLNITNVRIRRALTHSISVFGRYNGSGFYQVDGGVDDRYSINGNLSALSPWSRWNWGSYWSNHGQQARILWSVQARDWSTSGPLSKPI